jgi:hypothetical protein
MLYDKHLFFSILRTMDTPEVDRMNDEKRGKITWLMQHGRVRGDLGGVAASVSHNF